MKRQSDLLFWVALLTILCLTVAGATFAGEKTTATLTGEIEAVERDEDGTVTSVALADDEWGWVLVASAGKGAELLNHVGSIVKITGEIEELGEDDEFDYVIVVSKYSIEAGGEKDGGMDEDSGEQN